MILYRENPKDATKKILELINELSKVADTKLKYRNTLCSYTHNENELSEREIKKTIPYTIASEINLTTDIKDLYSENYRH